MMKYKIINAKMITPYRILTDAELCFDATSILSVSKRNTDSDGHYHLIDAQGNYLAPGFIDMHTHGAGGHDFMDGTEEALLGAARVHSELSGAHYAFRGDHGNAGLFTPF